METSALDETVRYAIWTRHYLAYATPEGKGRVVAPHAYGITPEREYTVVCWCFATGRGPSAAGDWELVQFGARYQQRGHELGGHGHTTVDGIDRLRVDAERATLLCAWRRRPATEGHSIRRS